MVDSVLADRVIRFKYDPLGFVRWCFPWGEGDLVGCSGPRPWQEEVLRRLGDGLVREPGGEFREVLRQAVSSGHGIGKGCLSAWVLLWSMSVQVDCRCVVTANTENQLRTKTWPEVCKWHRMMIHRDWFRVTATSIFSSERDREKTWRVDAIPWSEEKPEAFAGLHNQGRRIVLVFDEASSIPDKIWEVSEGALTDEGTDIIWLVLGNPTRNVGRFRDCFGRYRHRWETMQVDARDVPGTNSSLHAKWLEDYGEDSDFFRVRVRGMFPQASSLQFIGTDTVAEAMRREARSMLGDAKVMSLDIARGGEDNCVFMCRTGLDARTFRPVVIPGSEARDSMRLAAKACDLLEEHKPDQFFVDGTGVGGPVVDRIRQLGYRVTEVQFGSRSPDRKYGNMRSYMWHKMREWLRSGGAIPDDPELEEELTSVEFRHNKRDQLLLESKEDMKRRGLRSPDKGDALAMLFAYPVRPTVDVRTRFNKKKHGKSTQYFAEHEWDPLHEEWM